MSKVIIIEPYYGGSHKKMIDTLTEAMDKDNYHLITMTPKKWPWRARCSSLYATQNLPLNLSEYGFLFCSSVISLAEFMGMNPQLVRLKKIVYFHENQIVYPVQSFKERDFQFGYNQVTTCMAADQLIFNSQFNLRSFVDNINKFMKAMPDYRFKDLPETISPKCSVLYYPVDFSFIDSLVAVKKQEQLEEKEELEKASATVENERLLHIVWPHRWEFDKNPEGFFHTLFRLVEENVNFKLSVLGERPPETPQIFNEARVKLKDQIIHFGYVEDPLEFYKILCDADVVVSTAKQEFFGVAIMESVRAGCFPLLPNSLVYPELYPEEFLYETDSELYETLKSWCLYPELVAELNMAVEMEIQQFASENLLPSFLALFR